MTDLKLRLEGLRGFAERVGNLAKEIDSGDLHESAVSVSFATPELMFSALTPTRWMLIARLKEIGPSFVDALANALSRDVSAVQADIDALSGLDLVEIDESGKIRIPWSKVTAELSFEHAA